MKLLYIEATDETPEVSFNAEDGNLTIKGKSMPENVNYFYQPVLDWLDEYVQSPQPSTVLTLNFEYFNTSSSKIILDIIIKLEQAIRAGSDVQAKWMYYEMDDDLRDLGEEYSDMTDVPMEFIAYV